MPLYSKKNLLDKHNSIKRRELKIGSGAKGLRIRLRDATTGAFVKEEGRYGKNDRQLKKELEEREKIIDLLSPIKTYPAPILTLNQRIKTNISTWENSLDSRNDYERALLLFIRFRQTGNTEFVRDVNICTNNVTSWLELIFAGEEWIVNTSAIHKEDILFEPILRKREAIQYVPAYSDTLTRKFDNAFAFYNAFEYNFQEVGGLDTYIIIAQEDISFYHALPIAYSADNR
jgi:hypothetical protein